LCYNRRVISLVYLSNQAPSKLASDLMASGFQVWEALSVSEVLYLIEHETWANTSGNDLCNEIVFAFDRSVCHTAAVLLRPQDARRDSRRDADATFTMSPLQNLTIRKGNP
jgi:hypothetical protein